MTNNAIRQHVSAHPVEMRNSNQFSASIIMPFNTSGRLGVYSYLISVDMYNVTLNLFCV